MCKWVQFKDGFCLSYTSRELPEEYFQMWPWDFASITINCRLCISNSYWWLRVGNELTGLTLPFSESQKQKGNHNLNPGSAMGLPGMWTACFPGQGREMVAIHCATRNLRLPRLTHSSSAETMGVITWLQEKPVFQGPLL